MNQREKILIDMGRQYVWFLFREHPESGEPELLVGITPDHEIEYGPNYDPQGAAKVFWQAVGRNMPAVHNMIADELEGVGAEIVSIFPENTNGWTTCVLIGRELKTRAAIYRKGLRLDKKETEK
jgi:hypothetical protein